MTEESQAQRLGASESEFEKEKGAASGRFLKLAEGPNIHRVVRGFTVINQVFFPTVVENEAGDLAQTVRAMDVPKGDQGFHQTLVGKMINLCWSVHKKHGLDWSPLNINRRGIAVVFDINEDVEGNEDNLPTLQIVSYPISVVKDERHKTGILYLQKQETVTKPKMLVNGPMWAFNAVIEKSVDATKSGVRGTSYSVRVMTEDKVFQTFTNKLPLEALESNWDGFNKLYNQVFTDVQREVIDATFDEKNVARKATYKPYNNEKMLEFFNEFPLDFTALDSEDKALFPHAEEVVKTMENMGVRLIEGSSVISESHQLTESTTEETVEEKAEGAEPAEVVSEETSEKTSEKETSDVGKEGW